MATQIPALTEISAFPTRVLPQQTFDAAVRTCMSQLQGMVSELNDDFIPAVNTISTNVQSQSSTATTKASAAAASATLAATNSQLALGSAFFNTDQAGIACRDITTQRTVRNQIIETTIYNRGVVSGAALSKVSSTRTVTVASGTLFANGRVYSFTGGATVSVPTNASSSSKTAYIYLTLSDDTFTLSITDFGVSAPSDGISLGSIRVNANDTGSNLNSATLYNSARTEAAWPQVQTSAAYAYLALPNRLISNNYQVSVEIVSSSSVQNIGSVIPQNKLVNGFQLLTTGTADAISVRALVQFYDI